MLAVLGTMLWGCQIVFFPDFQEEQEQQNQNPEPEIDPVLKVKTFGAYNLDGVDYVYRRGEWQLSRNYSPDGKTVSFSMVDPANRVVYSVSGIKPAVALVGNNIQVKFSARTPEKELKSFSSSSATVLGENGDTLWLKTSQGPYFVVKK